MDADVNISLTLKDTHDELDTNFVMSNGSISSTDSESTNQTNEEDNVVEDNVSVIEKNTEKAMNWKKPKLSIESGCWSCQDTTCNDKDDEDMLMCSQCKSKFHYRCTDLPPYQIVRFKTQGYRKYICERCVDTPEDLPDKCRKGNQHEYDLKNPENINMLQREIDEKNKILASINMAYDTQKRLIEDKDELISTQKAIILSLSRGDKDNTLNNSSEIIAQRDLKLELLAKEMEDLKSSKNSNTDISNIEKKFKDMEEKLRVEALCKNDLIKELESQTSLTKGMELAVETQKDIIKAKEEIIENMKLIKSLSNDAQSEMEQQDLKQGVYECIEFLKCHATNGVLLNGLLLWIDIQRKTTAEIFGSRKRLQSLLKKR